MRKRENRKKQYIANKDSTDLPDFIFLLSETPDNATMLADKKKYLLEILFKNNDTMLTD